jgi:hypothetical protein
VHTVKHTQDPGCVAALRAATQQTVLNDLAKALYCSEFCVNAGRMPAFTQNSEQTYNCRVKMMSDSQSSLSQTPSTEKTDHHDKNTHHRPEQKIKAAISFDADGIPIDFIMPDDLMNDDWIQVCFQALSLNFLLSDLWALDQKDHCISHGDRYAVIIVSSDVSSERGYMAFLLDKMLSHSWDELDVSWFKNVSAQDLKDGLS